MGFSSNQRSQSFRRTFAKGVKTLTLAFALLFAVLYDAWRDSFFLPDFFFQKKKEVARWYFFQKNREGARWLVVLCPWLLRVLKIIQDD